MYRRLLVAAVTVMITGFAAGWLGSALLRARQAASVPAPAPVPVSVVESAPAPVVAAATIAAPVATAAAAPAAVSAAARPAVKQRRKPRFQDRRHPAGPTKPSERHYQVAAGETPAVLEPAAVSGFELKGLDNPATTEEALQPETMVVVKRSEHRLYLYKEGELVRSYRVGVGKHRGSTPSGKFRIIGKAHNPAWNYKGKFVPGGSPSNPLGKWWMGLSVTHRSGTRFGIHGTNAPWSIGGNVSRGCIRMYNKDAASLYRQVSAGTPVVIY